MTSHHITSHHITISTLVRIITYSKYLDLLLTHSLELLITRALAAPTVATREGIAKATATAAAVTWDGRINEPPLCHDCI